jgi:hypothetical protein
MLKAAFPWLVRVIGSTALVVPRVWLPKFRLLAVRLTAGVPPVPVRFTVWGLPARLSAMLTAAVRVPVAVGVNVTLIVQLPPTASEPLHVVVSAKSPTLAPIRLMRVIVKLAVPVLVTVTLCTALVVPTF